MSDSTHSDGSQGSSPPGAQHREDAATHAFGYNPPSKANPKQLASGVLFLGAAVLSAASLFVSWWTIRYTGPASWGMVSGTYYFLPGNSARIVANGMSNSATYSALGLGSVGSLYGTIQVGAIVMAIAAASAGVVAAVRSLRRSSSPVTYVLVAVLGVAAAVASGLAVVLYPFFQPQAFPNMVAFCGGESSASTPCGAFYGSGSMNGASESWGPDWGWFIAIAVLVLVAVALVLWAISQRGASAIPPSAPKADPMRASPR